MYRISAAIDECEPSRIMISSPFVRRHAVNPDLNRLQPYPFEKLRQKNVVVLPGSYIAGESCGVNPGANFIRIALIAEQEECLEAAHRINDCCLSL
jgi:hypothetical protein